MKRTVLAVRHNARKTKEKTLMVRRTILRGGGHGDQMVMGMHIAGAKRKRIWKKLLNANYSGG